MTVVKRFCGIAKNCLELQRTIWINPVCSWGAIQFLLCLWRVKTSGLSAGTKKALVERGGCFLRFTCVFYLGVCVCHTSEENDKIFRMVT